jgi:hypothetical protein
MKTMLLVTVVASACFAITVSGRSRFCPEATAPVALLSQAEGEDQHKEGDHEDDHKGEKKDLGKQQVGGFTVQVTQVGDVKPGEEAVFVITVSGGTGKPKAVRGWVGVESGERSIKTKAEDEEREWHLHHQVSKPIPANCKLWVELETSSGKQKVAFDLK